MGWRYESDAPVAAQHEGYAVAVDSYGARVEVAGADDWRGVVDEEGLDVVAGLRPACSCGWQVWDVLALHSDFKSFPLVVRADGSVNVEASEASPRVRWSSHVAELLAESVFGQVKDRLMAAVDALGALPPLDQLRMHRLLEQYVGSARIGAVRQARSEKASWAAIGEAQGTTKQSAYERFRQYDPLRWDGSSPHCGAAHEDDPTLCEGGMRARSSRTIAGTA